jgi:UDP-N-acetylmuramoylalanine--D-glutamate ligase
MNKLGTIRKLYKGKKVLIVGLGKSGAAAFDLISHVGAEISVYDTRDIEWESPKLFKTLQALGVRCFLNGAPVQGDAWDWLIMSPGVSPDQPFIRAAVSAGARFTGDLELAWLIRPGDVIAITGTNGKTTTTSLTGAIYKNAGILSAVTGNIGVPVIETAMSARGGTKMIVEVSSFQLETIHDFVPEIAVFLNLTPDHLDRHKNLTAYGIAKARIFKNQSKDNFLIYNFDDPHVRALAAQSNAQQIPFSRLETRDVGAFVRDGQIVLRDGAAEHVLIAASELRIPGLHNLENALAAAAAAFCGGIPVGTIAQTLRSFNGVAHRLEPVAEIDGVRFVNDSKGTNPDAAIKAVEAVSGGIVLIAGGYDKQADYSAFVRSFKGKVRHLILLGQTAEAIRTAAAAEGFTDVSIVDDMGSCVRLGFELAEPGDTVLLSPACASWGMYSNFEARGDHFKEQVSRLSI